MCASAGLAPGQVQAADDVFIYSSAASIRSINLTRGSDVLLTSAPGVASANALAFNPSTGFVYYGDNTSVYRWDPALGAGTGAHSLMMNFASGSVSAPITELGSTGGSYSDGIYYVGSEDPASGAIVEIFALRMSLDGTQVVSAEALDLLAACGCTSNDLGGFGDIAAFEEGGVAVIYGSSTGLGGGGASSGRWKFVPSTNTFTLLAPAANGQLSRSIDDRLYSNVGNAVREVDRVTGVTSPTTLFTTSNAIFDFTSGFVIDFGDAPDSYGAAYHRQSGGVSTTYIGNLAADNDSGTLNSVAGFVNGAGDDSDGSDDEDAINVTPTIGANSSNYSVSLDCTAGTRVAGWIDFNVDGSFGSNERNDNHPASCSNGSVTLSWDSLPSLSGGNSYMRLRASTNIAAISSPTGVAPDGEVEDHPVVIDAPSFGSCPAGSQSTVYTPNDLPLAIPVGTASVSSSLTVPDNEVITDVNVLGLEGTHSWINDLQFTLSHEGVSRTLYGYACGREDNFDLSLDDESSGTPSCPPVGGGTYPPVQSLDAFDGQSSTGDWVLTVTDQYVGADGGSVDNWSLEICSAAPGESAPAIRLGKAALVSGRDVTVTLAAENVGNTALENVQITDELNPVFGAGRWSIVTTPVIVAGPDGMSVNASWSGVAPQAGLLANASELGVGERVDVRFTVRVDSFATAPTGGPAGDAWGEYVNTATASARAAGSGEQVNDTSNNGLDLTVDGDAATPIVVDASAALSGVVFNDSASDETLAHDGLRAANETGAGGRIIEARTLAGDILATAVTDADGVWALQIPVSETQQAVSVSLRSVEGSRSVSEAPVYVDAQAADGRLTLTPGVGGELTGIDFGVIDTPQLDADRQASVVAGASVVLAHRYVASSHGSLAINLDALGDSPGSARVVLDTNCDGAIDSSEQTVPNTLALARGDSLCLLVELLMPPDAQPGRTFAYSLDTALALSDVSGIGHGVVLEVSNRDTVTVLATGAGQLELEKTVINVSRAGSAGVRNAALPGETLEFVLIYRNSGSADLPGLIVNDAAPPYTAVVPGTALCTDTPGGMNCLARESGNLLDWAFTGDLAPGQSGSVSYQVTVD